MNKTTKLVPAIFFLNNIQQPLPNYNDNRISIINYGSPLITHLVRFPGESFYFVVIDYLVLQKLM